MSRKSTHSNSNANDGNSKFHKTGVGHDAFALSECWASKTGGGGTRRGADNVEVSGAVVAAPTLVGRVSNGARTAVHPATLLIEFYCGVDGDFHDGGRRRRNHVLMTLLDTGPSMNDET